MGRCVGVGGYVGVSGYVGVGESVGGGGAIMLAPTHWGASVRSDTDSS